MGGERKNKDQGKGGKESAYAGGNVTASKMEVLSRGDADESTCDYCGDAVGFRYHGTLCLPHF